MKRSTILFLGLAALVSLLLLNRQPLLPVLASPAAGPTLSLPDTTADINSTVTLPITFGSDSNSISSIVFSIDFDETLLSFDDTDANLDGIPDNITLNVPIAFVPSASYDATDTDGELDFTIFDFAPPLAALPDGEIGTITFNTGNTTGLAAVNFAADPPTSFGSSTGQSIPGTTSNGSVNIMNIIIPVADFTFNADCDTEPLTVHFTDASMHNPTSWQWEFGDGGTSTEQHPTHTYASAGTYNVKLTATNSAGSDDETKSVTVKAVCAAFSATPDSGVAPLLVQFTDESLGNPTNWQWDFGDGSSSTEQNPSHTYAADGTYTVTLTASNSAGADVATKIITVSTTTTTINAAFSATPRCGLAPLMVQFSDESEGSPTSWLWDFGDGSSSAEQHPSHTYSTNGTYTVTLTASNVESSDSKTEENYIIVAAECPALMLDADFSADSQMGNVPHLVRFTDASEGNPTSWLWDFGDGSSSTEQHPEHSYNNVGSYTVKLTVTNEHGSDMEEKTGYIVVEEAKLYLPILRRQFPSAVYGRIVTREGQGYGGVVINTNTGKTAVSDSNGYYIFSPLSAGSHTIIPTIANANFDPPAHAVSVPPNQFNQNFTILTHTPTPTYTPTPTKTPKPPKDPTKTPTPPPGCWHGISNGSFESSHSWVIGDNEYPASYSTLQSHSGGRSMRVGITNAAHNQFSYSSVWQSTYIPSSATDAKLSFWLYTLSSGTLSNQQAAPDEVPTSANESSLNDDAQYVLLYDQYGAQYTLLFQRNNQGWQQYQADLGQFAGQQVILYFGVYNNGFSGTTGMYVDDVELVSCR